MNPDLAGVQRRTVLILSLAQLFSGIGNGAGLAIGSILAVELSGRAELAGAATTAISLAAAMAALPLASLAARRGRRRALGTGLALAAAGAALMILAPNINSFAALLAGAALLGVGNAANLQARFAAADLAAPEHRGRDLALVVWSITIGAVAGPNLIRPGAALGNWLGISELSGPFIFSLAGMLLAVVLITVGLRPDPLQLARSLHAGAPQADEIPADEVPAARRGSLTTGLTAISGSRRAVLGLATVIGAHLVMVAVMSMTPVHLKILDSNGGSGHNPADTLAFIGFTISLHIAGMFALSPVMGWLTDRLGRIPTILVAQCLLIAAVLFAGLGHESQWLVSIGLVLLGLGWSAATISGSTLLTESVPLEVRVPVQGVSDTFMGGAGALGAVLAGLALAAFGFYGVNLIGAGVAVAVALLAVVVRQPSAVSASPASR